MNLLCLNVLHTSLALHEVGRSAYLYTCANELHNVVVPTALQQRNLLAYEGLSLLLQHMQRLQPFLA